MSSLTKLLVATVALGAAVTLGPVETEAARTVPGEGIAVGDRH